jgi:hypothetical protein
MKNPKESEVSASPQAATGQTTRKKCNRHGTSLDENMNQ